MSTQTAKIFPVNSYQGRGALLSNQYSQVGTLVERWADVVDGCGEKAADFWVAFDQARRTREMGVKHGWDDILSTGLGAPSRVMDITRRGPVRVAVFIAPQGKDLYLSWRCFIKNGVSIARIMLWLLLIAAPAFYLSTDRYWGQTYFDDELFAQYFLVGLAITGVLLILSGLSRHRGDALGLLRPAIHELQYDEVASLSTGVHHCLLEAADKVGIDSSKLLVREPAYVGNRQKRRI